MLTPGIYYPRRNSHRQLMKTLPGKNIYPTDVSYFHYTEGEVFYVNYNSALSVGDIVNIYINDTLNGVAKILNEDGLYVYTLTPPYGTFVLKSVFPDTSVNSQTFVATNLYTLLHASAMLWAQQKIKCILSAVDLYVSPQTDGIFRGQASPLALTYNFGMMIGFPQPADWPVERYAVALGGDQSKDIPGIFPTLKIGSSVGAVKDIVKSVTEYAMSDEDFSLLEGIGWVLSEDGYKYRSDGTPLGVEETTAVGPHYFLTDNVPAVSGIDIAMLRSDLQQAFTLMLNIQHDGFRVAAGNLARNMVGEIDYLTYNWLNPFADPEYQVPPLGCKTFTVAVSDPVADKTIVIPDVFQESALGVYINGIRIYKSQYTVTDSTIVLDASVNIQIDDTIQVTYRTVFAADITQHEITITGSVSSPYQITLPANAAPYGMRVEVNGSKLSVDQYTIDSINEISIVGQLYDEDEVCISFYENSINHFEEQTAINKPTIIEFEKEVDEDSLKLYINGQIQPSGSVTKISATEVEIATAIHDELEDDDVISITADIFITEGYNVKVIQDGVQYTQGLHFEVNYTTGELMWSELYSQPLGGTTYQVYYTYFPKQILSYLLGLVKPATIKLILQFTTTDDEIFNPWTWHGEINPSGDVIL